MTKNFHHFISFLSVFILTCALFISPAKANAACEPLSGSCGGSLCRLARSSTTYCCATTTECNIFKTSQGSNASGGTPDKLGSFPDTCTNGKKGIQTALGCMPYETKDFTLALIGFLISISGGIAIIIMIIATIQIMTGGGNPEQVKKGKELFTGAITGLLFIIFSVSLLRIIAGDIIKLPGF